MSLLPLTSRKLVNSQVFLQCAETKWNPQYKALRSEIKQQKSVNH